MGSDMIKTETYLGVPPGRGHVLDRGPADGGRHGGPSLRSLCRLTGGSCWVGGLGARGPVSQSEGPSRAVGMLGCCGCGGGGGWLWIDGDGCSSRRPLKLLSTQRSTKSGALVDRSKPSSRLPRARLDRSNRRDDASNRRCPCVHGMTGLDHSPPKNRRPPNATGRGWPPPNHPQHAKQCPMLRCGRGRSMPLLPGARDGPSNDDPACLLAPSDEQRPLDPAHTSSSLALPVRRRTCNNNGWECIE